MEMISTLVSIVAVVISLAALIRGRETSKRLIELEEIHAQLSRKQLEDYEIREKASLKARLGVTLHSDGSSGRFVVENNGPAAARNIYFSLSEEGSHNPIAGGDLDKKVPYPLLNPGESYHFRANFPLAVTQMIYGVDLRWHTDDGIQHKGSFTVAK